MKTFLNRPLRSMLPACALFAVSCLSAVSSDVQSGELQIKSIQGTVTYATDHSAWTDLKPGMVLGPGARLKTGPGSTADLEFEYSGTALRLRPDSTLELARMDEVVAGENVIIDTQLNLEAGSLVGSQRKLDKPSTFTIATPNGSATIRGTEYMVSSDGAVSCLRGQVAVNSSHQGNPVNAAVPAGFSFSPATCQVAATTPNGLAGFNQDIQAVRDIAGKLGDHGRGNPGGQPDCDVSPTKGDHDHDHDDGNGHDHGDGHDDNHGDDHGGGHHY